MSDIVVPSCNCVESTVNFGRFLVEPVETGFGVTLGNSLRRVLLGYLQGAAVTRVKIEGLQHEFSSIPYVKEDTMEFLLNIKELRLKPLSGQPGKLFLEMEGEGQVCAADIQPTTDFEIVNPELHLATLDTADARLYVEFDVELGIGYQEAESGDNLPPEVIGADAVFSPIRKVNYTVEPTYVGRETKYERLWLEVWTDGTLSALDTVSRSASLLMGQLAPFADMANLSQLQEKGKLAADAIPNEKYNMPVEQLDLSVRTMNCLRHAAISTVGEILEKGEKELLLLRNFGQKSMKEIEERLTTMDLSLHAKTEDIPSEDDDEREPE